MLPFVEEVKGGMIDQADPRQRRRRAWEVIAPPGFHFAPGGEHSLIEFSSAEAQAYGERDLEQCDPGCACDPCVED